MADLRSVRGPLLWSGASSAVVAGLGLLTLVVVARHEGPSTYAGFAVVWGLFFGVGGVFAGLQQEVTRSVSIGEISSGPRLLPLVLVVGLLIGIAGAALMVQAGVEAAAGAPGVVGVGLLGLAGLTFVCGVLAARADWSGLATVLIVDAATRTLTVASLSLTDHEGLLPVGVAFGSLAWPLLLVHPRFRSVLSARAGTVVGSFFAKSVIAMAATGCAALLVAGLPILIATFRDEPLEAQTGAVLAALVLIRSSLLVLVYGLRPVILRAFLNTGDLAGTLGRAWRWCLLAGLAWSVAVTAVGPSVIEFVLGAGFAVSHAECAGIALGTVGIMMLVVSGLALVALDEHLISGFGWLLALLVSVLLIPVPQDSRTSVVCVAAVGPWAGVLAHAWWLTRERHRLRQHP